MTDYYKRCSRCDQWQPREEYRPSPTDRDGLSAWCKSCFREYQKDWRKKNSALMAFRRRLKLWSIDGFVEVKFPQYQTRAKSFGVECTLTKEEFRELLSSSGGFCYYCKKSFRYQNLTLDHVIPLSKGGPHSKDNVVVACLRCNVSKFTRDWPKYLEKEIRT